MPYLRYVRENKRLFRTAMENATVLGMKDTYERMFHYVFVPVLERYGVPEADRPYIMTFYISGLMAIVTEWLENDCMDSMEHIISVMQRCVARHKEGV